MDPKRGILERSLAGFNQPKVFKVSTVWDVPVGKGRRFLGGANRLADALLGGWQHTIILSVASDKPWGLPANAIMMRNPAEPGGINWNQSVVQGVYPGVAQMGENGVLALMPYSANVQGCSLSNLDFIALPPYAPTEILARTGTVRRQDIANVDLSLGKTYAFTERLRLQFRGIARNLQS